MHWLSRSAEQLIAELPQHGGFDALIVGSGYGGAVAALRLAEAGQDVCVLERGQEWVAGEFPTDMSQAGKHVRAETNGKDGPSAMGYESALFDFRIGEGIGALVGNGLGGGSLINAGVALVPDAAVFRQPHWPKAFAEEDLSPWFNRAKEALEIATPGGQGHSFDPRDTDKYRRLKELSGRIAADGANVRFEDAPVAVHFGGPTRSDLGPRDACVGCGNCVSGCNYNAKLSLAKTYLPRAYKAGARMYTGVSVLHVRHDPAGDPARPWAVTFVRTGERKLQHDIAAAGKPAKDDWLYEVRAARVVLAAGTFGSTEILLRSRAQGLETAGAPLGARVSGNGDDVAFAANLPADATAVGRASTLRDQRKVGPTISAVIRIQDPRDPSRSTLLQDGAVPGLMAPVFHELIATLGTIAQLDRWKLHNPEGGDALALKPSTLARTLTLLGMGHDRARGRIEFDEKTGRTKWGWDDAAGEPGPKLHRDRARPAVNGAGLYIQNPATGILPEGIAGMLNGPQPGGGLFTVHPLGGCTMADSVDHGVCDDRGRVFRRDGSVHDGLFVMDGSVMPGSLGVNPMLTIAALAERSCAALVRELPAGKPRACALGRHPDAPPKLDIGQAAKPGVTMAEVLRGKFAVGAPFPGLEPHEKELPAALFVQMTAPDWQAFFDDPSHRVTIPKATSEEDYRCARLVLQRTEGGRQAALALLAESGSVNLYRRREDGFLTRLGGTLRGFFTYLFGRWWPDAVKEKNDPPENPAPKNWGAWIASAAKSLWHASEVRLFEYRMVVRDPRDDAKYIVTGTKVVEAAASWGALAAWVRERIKGNSPPVRRRTLWEQLGEMDVRLEKEDGTLVMQGRLAMDIPDIVRNLLPQLSAQRDTLAALVALAGYPLMLLRGLAAMRLLDFRAPDYRKKLPARDPALDARPGDPFELDLPENRFPDLPTRNHGKVSPEPPIAFHVKDNPRAQGEAVRLGLIRYRQKTLQVRPDPQGGPDVRKARAILLINGFAQSTRAFVAPELGQDCLAARLYDAGWDVWMLEYRVSPLLAASAKFSTMDDVAAFDIPSAVDLILKSLAAENEGLDPRKLRIHAFSHCVGSASLAMSLAGRHLASPHPESAGLMPDKKLVHRLAGVVFSQFQPYVIGSDTAQQRLQFGSFLRNILGRDMLNFSAGTAAPDVVHAMMDRVFATMPYEGQRCPGEHDLRIPQPDATTCKRMAGILSRLFNHAQLVPPRDGLPGTHENLDWYFGRTNLGVFLHGAKCVTYERLVDNEGRSYMSDDRVREYLDMPVLVMHGEDNVLFDVESMERSANQIGRVFGTLPADKGGYGRINKLRIEGHAHFDCTIGKNTPTEVFPHLESFFDNAYVQGIPASTHQPIHRSRARLPVSGPILGWVRASATGGTLLRMWAEFDHIYPDTPVGAITVTTFHLNGKPQAPKVEAWWPINFSFQHGTTIAVPGSQRPVIPQYPVILAAADVEVPPGATDVKIRMVGLYVYQSPVPVTQATTTQPRQDIELKVPNGYPAEWGYPMLEKEVDTPYEPMFPPGEPLVKVWLSDLPYEPGTVNYVTPMGLQLGDDTRDALFTTLENDLYLTRSRAMLAAPGTISRLSRELRSPGECEVIVADHLLRYGGTAPFTFLAAGCRHGGLTGFEADRADHALLAAAATLDTSQPRFMAMLGDQIYADARAGVFDTASRLERILPRYRQAFGSPGFRAVSSRLPLVMAVDDHEINDSWGEEQAYPGPDAWQLADFAKTAFHVFQRAHGPDALPGTETRDATYGSSAFECAGVPFFVLDARTHRYRVRAEDAPAADPARRVLDEATWQQLETWLTAQQSRCGARPKWLLCGSVIAPGLAENDGSPAPRDADTWQLAPDDRARLFDLLSTRRIENVVLLSSDYHCSATADIVLGDSGVRAFAIVAPPLHAPMRFANAEASTVMKSESIPLPSGGAARVTLRWAWDGDGWMECRMAPQGAGGREQWSLETVFHLRKLEDGAAFTVTKDQVLFS